MDPSIQKQLTEHSTQIDIVAVLLYDISVSVQDTYHFLMKLFEAFVHLFRLQYKIDAQNYFEKAKNGILLL